MEKKWLPMASHNVDRSFPRKSKISVMLFLFSKYFFSLDFQLTKIGNYNTVVLLSERIGLCLNMYLSHYLIREGRL